MALGYNIIKTAFLGVKDSILNINTTTSQLSGLTTDLNKITKVALNTIGATTGSAGLAKGGVDFGEALMYQDGVCAVVSAVGCAADCLQITASFVPGPNVTVVVTAPISVGCKVFVDCCKRSRLPWGGC